MSRHRKRSEVDSESPKRLKRREQASYREASSDDEFAKTHFMYSSDEDSFSPKRGKKRQRESSARCKDEDKTSDSEDDEDKIDYRIEHILGRRSMTAREWTKITDNMNTREVTKGSVLQQPDKEYYDSSDTPVEKYLIKWAHASYLHVSWETEKDLEELAGKGIKHSIKKFLHREAERRELFEDLSKGEYFPSSYTQIERILDVDDKDINISTIQWDSIAIPNVDQSIAQDSLENFTEIGSENGSIVVDSSDNDAVEAETVDIASNDDEDATSEADPFAMSEDENLQPVNPRVRRAAQKKIIYLEDSSDDEFMKDQDQDQDQVDDKPEKAKSKNADHSTKHGRNSSREHRIKHASSELQRKTTVTKNQYLHGSNCWVTIKWEGLSYSEVSFESLNDIARSKIEYEAPLRMFYKREQAPAKESQLAGTRKLNVDHNIIGPTAEQPSFPGGELRDYQWEGVRWMLFNIMQGRNSILADEMGLGKTIQSSTLLHMLKKHQKSAGPFLVVAPLSTIVNWQREVRTWTNLDAIMYYGSQDDRELIRSFEFNFLDKKKKGYKVEVVITTPETCIATDEKTNGRAKRVLSRIGWDVVIVDEAHKLKNYESKLSSTLREEYSYRNCVLLTGTPLQNNTEELWTLLNFVGPSDFADHEEFMEKFGELKCASQLEELHRRIKPYLLRREKENVEKTVPPKEEIVIEVELTVPQKQYYRAIFEQKTGFLYRANMKDGPSLTNLAMELRKCCNHPYLIKGAPTEIAKHFKDDTHQDILVKSSGKMTLLAKLLPKLKADGHRVLIFSQFRMMLDIIEDCIHYAGYTYERVDGSIVGSKRQAAIDRFTNNDNIFVMLLSTKAGGVGINLTAADTVIIYDSDWNPQNDIQAQARAHRIGQTRSVTVYRLLTRKTYEMAMFRAASIKLGLDYAVMHNMDQSVALMTANSTNTRGRGGKQQQQQQLAGISNERADTVSALSRRELENLLKHGAYDIFMEEKDGKSENESKAFVEESIEQILERSSIFMHQENDSKVQCMKTNSSFAKASFVSATGSNTSEEEEVAIDDPDFWSKVVGLSVEDQAIAMGAKRKCRQNVESYKEPGLSIKSIYGDRKSAYMTDSDNDSDGEGRGNKRRRKGMEEPEIVAAEFTTDNLQSILTAMTNHGYGPWSVIRRVTKLWWKDSDIAKACTFNLLANMMWASFVNSSDAKSKKSSDGNNISENLAGDCPEVAVEADNSASGWKFDINMFLFLLRRYKGCKLAFATYLLYNTEEEETESASSTTLESKLLSLFISKMDDLKFDLPIPALALRKAFQTAMITIILEKQSQYSIDLDENTLLGRWSSEIISSFATHKIGQELYDVAGESDQVKLQKRVGAAKLKLLQIDDLFEAHFYSLYSQKVATSTDSSIPSSSSTDNVAEMDADTSETDSNKSSYTNILKQLSNTEDQESMLNQWTIENDHSLLLAVDRFGAPDGKRRYVKIMEFLASRHSNIVYNCPNAVVAESTGTTEDANIGETETKSNDTESAAVEPSVTPVTLSNNSGIHEKYPPKFLVNRLKALTKMLRCTDEELASLAKQEAAAAAVLAKQQAAELKAKVAERQLRKKHVQQIFKTIGRIGYPRSGYTVILENLSGSLGAESDAFQQRSSYLLSWETFLQECEVTATMDKPVVQEVVTAAISILNDPDQIGGIEEICTSGVLEEVSYKTIDSAFEKVDTIHHIRILLALHSEDELKQLIKTSCKIAGPDVPSFRRDSSMPVWWTLQHDLELLRLCLTLGLNQWKKLLAEPLMSTAPADFEMPPKAHGTEWVLALTAKNAEKRVQSLLRGLPAMRTLNLPVPTSPQRKSSQRSSSVASGINTLAAAFSNISNKNSTSATSNTSGSTTGSGATSWLSKVSSSAAKTAAEEFAVADAAPSIPIAIAAAEVTSALVVIDDEFKTVPSQLQCSEPEVVPIATPQKVDVSSSPSVCEVELQTTVAQPPTIVLESVVELVLDDLTPLRADETTASKKLNQSFEGNSKDCLAEKIDMLVDSCAATDSKIKQAVAIPTAAKEKAEESNKTANKAKKVTSKKAEKSASEPVATKSILSFFKRA